MDSLIEFDRELFLALNAGHTEWLDFLMYWITNRYTWFPLYFLLAFYLLKYHRKKGLLVLVLAGLLILLVDQTVASLIKPFFERPRPCHDQLISGQVHLVTACGGRYGFFSAHAANTFAIATYLSLWFRPGPMIWLLAWALLVSYSRVYVGVHYPLDILAGALYGALLGAATFKVGTYAAQRIFRLL